MPVMKDWSWKPPPEDQLPLFVPKKPERPKPSMGIASGETWTRQGRVMKAKPPIITYPAPWVKIIDVYGTEEVPW